MSGEIVIRETVPADLAAIVEVHKKGFGYDKEAGLTAELLSDCRTGRLAARTARRGGRRPHPVHPVPHRRRRAGPAVVLPPRTARRRSLLPEAGRRPTADRRGAAAAAGAGRETRLRTRTQGVLPAPRIHSRSGKTGIPGSLPDRGKTRRLLDGAGADQRRIFRTQRPGRMRRRPEPPRTLAGIKPHLR